MALATCGLSSLQTAPAQSRRPAHSGFQTTIPHILPQISDTFTPLICHLRSCGCLGPRPQTQHWYDTPRGSQDPKKRLKRRRSSVRPGGEEPKKSLKKELPHSRGGWAGGDHRGCALSRNKADLHLLLRFTSKRVPLRHTRIHLVGRCSILTSSSSPTSSTAAATASSPCTGFLFPWGSLHPSPCHLHCHPHFSNSGPNSSSFIANGDHRLSP